MANKENNELEKRNQAFLIYQDENGIGASRGDRYLGHSSRHTQVPVPATMLPDEQTQEAWKWVREPSLDPSCHKCHK